MIDLETLSRRYGLPIGANGQSLTCGNGRIVVWDRYGDFAYTTCVKDNAAIRVYRARVGRTVYDLYDALTIAFKADRLPEVVKLLTKTVSNAA